MKLKNKKTKIYLCNTDLIDLALGATDIIAYPTLKDLKENKKCLDECGYCECELKIKILKDMKLVYKKKE